MRNLCNIGTDMVFKKDLNKLKTSINIGNKKTNTTKVQIIHKQCLLSEIKQ